MRNFIWLLAYVTLTLTGCATSPPISLITDSTKRFEIIGASVGPPSGNGWYTIDGPSPTLNTVIFYKETEGETIVEQSRRGHTYVVGLTVGDLEGMKFDSPKELGMYIDNNYRKSLVGHNRFRFIKSEWEADDTYNAVCVRWVQIQEDFNHPAFPNRLFIKDHTSIVCVHPLSSNHMVMASWGQSRPKYEAAWDFSNEVEAFLKSIEFIPVKLPERK